MWGEAEQSGAEEQKSTSRNANDLLDYLLILISIVNRGVFRDDLYIPQRDVNIATK